MKKISKNVLIQTEKDGKVWAIQRARDYEWREVIDFPVQSHLQICIDTDKFISILKAGITSIREEFHKAWIITREGEYLFPIAYENGFMVMDRGVYPPEREPDQKWTYDFSKKTINSQINGNTVNSASLLVVLGTNFVARNTTNVLEEYGDSSTALFSVSAQEYALISKMGKVELSYWDSGELVVRGKDSELRISKVYPKIDVVRIEEMFASKAFKTSFPNFKYTPIGKFSTEKLYITFKTGGSTIVSLTADLNSLAAKRNIEDVHLELDKPLTLEIMPKDIYYLYGDIYVSPVTTPQGKKFYMIKSIKDDKTVYVLVKEFYGEIKW